MADDSNTPESSGFRFATTRYVAALGIIALLAIGAYLLNDAIIREQAGTARVVNLAGRQRMLCQRAALLTLELSRPSDSSRLGDQEGELAKTLNDMESAHNALLYGSEAVDVPGTRREAVTAIYREDLDRLEARIMEFLDQGRSFLKLPAGQRALSPEAAYVLEAAHQPLLMAFEDVVAQIQAESEQSIQRLRRDMFVTLGVMLATLVLEALLLFRPLFERLRAAQAQLLKAAMTDSLTGCKNRRHLMDSAERELARSRRTGRPLAVLALDIDRFKTINDTWGHGIGDEAIIVLARTLAGAIRATDQLGRMGGDEFGLLLPETGADSAMAVAEKLRLAVVAATMDTPSGPLRMTISIGVTELMAADHTIAAAFDRADQALYQAKQAGRDRANRWSEDLPPQQAA